jgi:hypothetical protein
MRVALKLCLAVAVVLALSAPVASAAPDQVVVTGSITVPAGKTASDLVIVDGPATVAGHVTGNVIAVNGRVTISGTVDGDVVTVAKRARLLDGARVGGDVTYADKKPAVAPGAVVAGDVNHENWNFHGFGWLAQLAWWLIVGASTLILGLALLAFAPRAADAAWAVAQEHTGRACAWAAVLFFGVPIVAILAIVTVFGLPLGFGLLLAYVPLALIGYVTSCWIFGKIVVGKRGWGRMRMFLVGWAAARLVALLPGAGALLWVVASAFGLGVLLLAAWYASKPERAAQQPASPPPSGAPAPTTT